MEEGAGRAWENDAMEGASKDCVRPSVVGGEVMEPDR